MINHKMQQKKLFGVSLDLGMQTYNLEKKQKKYTQEWQLTKITMKNATVTILFSAIFFCHFGLKLHERGCWKRVLEEGDGRRWWNYKNFNPLRKNTDRGEMHTQLFLTIYILDNKLNDFVARKSAQRSLKGNFEGKKLMKFEEMAKLFETFMAR